MRNRKRRLALGLALAALALFVPFAWASDLFSDVPNSNPHHDRINAIAGAGITAGCAAGLYCPDLPVRRDEMATFLARGMGRIAMTAAAGTYSPLTDTGWTTLNTLTITTGGGGGAAGFVKLDAAVTTRVASAVGCPCAGEYRIFNETAGTESDHYVTQVDGIPPGFGFGRESTGLTWAAPVQTATSYVFRIQGRQVGTTAVTGRGVLSAVYAPFGSTGTSAP
jgi:hypothetical protein